MEGSEDLVEKKEEVDTYTVRALHSSLKKHRKYTISRFVDPVPDWNVSTDRYKIETHEEGIRTLECFGREDRNMRGVRERVGSGSSSYYALVMQGEDVVALPVEAWYTFRKAPTVGRNDQTCTLEEAEALMNARKTARGSVHPKLLHQHEFQSQVQSTGFRRARATDRESQEDTEREDGTTDSEEEERLKRAGAPSERSSRDVSQEAKKSTLREKGGMEDDGSLVGRKSRKASEQELEEDEMEGDKEDWEFEENATDDEEEQREDEREEVQEEAPKDMQEAFRFEEQNLDGPGRKLQEVLERHNLSEDDSMEVEEEEDEDYDNLDEDADRRFGNHDVTGKGDGKETEAIPGETSPPTGIKRTRQDETRDVAAASEAKDVEAEVVPGQAKRQKSTKAPTAQFFEKEIVSLLKKKAPMDSKEFARHFTNHTQNPEDKKLFTGTVRKLVKLVEIPPGSNKKFMVLK